MQYVTKDDVKIACKELGLTDWSKKKKPTVSLAEAKKVLKAIPKSGLKVDPDRFRAGLEVELEHGIMFTEYNITNNHPVLTGKIVMAHFMEMTDYYQRLEVAELEGDMLKALVKKDLTKARKYFKRIAKAKEELAVSEAKAIK
jgi:hypothetical protein